ncbi:MAG: hypothetical protein IPF83_14670 [Rhodanobacteraceae bacterium]|nr:hypothetical protein [Rhodanobacteraceae bacterium]MBK7044004.1 hypothetical protein [Rhodanobacteraceae bacterium]MBP9155949.1 hypothetical protein [Xanthomonadales bacterium]
MFLLHSIVVYLLGAALGPTIKPLGPVTASLIFVPFALMLSLIASDLSYRIAERPYFRKRAMRQNLIGRKSSEESTA